MQLEQFVGRKEDLLKIIRFNMERRTPMFYRTNDYIHSKRVRAIAEEFLPAAVEVYGDRLNPEKLLILAEVHDDAEIITGDIQGYDKDRMTPEQLAKIKQDETQAIPTLAARWPKTANGFEYAGLLINAANKDCLEAQLVSWADKTDAYCESMHEVQAGNKRFIGTTRDYATVKFAKLLKEFPELREAQGKHPLFTIPSEVNLDAIMRNGRYHTAESVRIQTGIPHYDIWRKITIEKLGIEHLTQIKEHEHAA